MKTHEQIAKEAADGVIARVGDGEKCYHLKFRFGDDQVYVLCDMSPENAERLRLRFYEMFLRVMREATECPVPSTLTDADLEKYRGWVPGVRNDGDVPLMLDGPLVRLPTTDCPMEYTHFKGATYAGVTTLSHAFRDLLSEVEHLRRCLRDCGEDGTAEVWSAGYRAGLHALPELKAVCSTSGGEAGQGD